MTTEEIKVMAKNRVKDIVNCISHSDFNGLASVTLIESSWCEDGESQAQGMNNFGVWLKEQLELWAEEEGKEFVFDEFDESRLDHLDIEDDSIWAEYTPASHGEPLDLWLEIDMHFEGDKLISEFNINM